ncbi:MAG: ATP synthase F1 subunit delta [Henriciella sp.]|nr:ATP synthase F1 subunit delta [Henriciella sp.]
MAAASATTASEAARRYAGALFDLAKDKGELAEIAGDLKTIEALAADSEDLTRLLENPAFAREDKVKALVAVAEKVGLTKTATGFIGTMAQNGRAGDLIGAAKHFDELYAKERGVKRAIARTASDMSADQRARLEQVLAKAVGGDVELETEVDPALVGGIQLRIGSTLIDASVSAKLDRMNTAMKGA